MMIKIISPRADRPKIRKAIGVAINFRENSDQPPVVKSVSAGHNFVYRAISIIVHEGDRLTPVGGKVGVNSDRAAINSAVRVEIKVLDGRDKIATSIVEQCVVTQHIRNSISVK